MFGGFFKNMVKSADEVLISGVKVRFLHGFCGCQVVTSSCFCFSLKQEVDDFFEQEKTFLLDYYSKIKDSTAKAEKMTRSHKSMGGGFTVKHMRLNPLFFRMLLILVFIADIADDYIHISATLNSICAEDSTPNKKWVWYIKVSFQCRLTIIKLNIFSVIYIESIFNSGFYLFLYFRNLEKLSDLFERLRVSIN